MTQRPLIATVRKGKVEIMPIPPRCCHCGSDEDVIERVAYIGGEGMVSHFECRDRVACWKRWDQKQGIGGEATIE